jgi:hypothetical protein
MKTVEIIISSTGETHLEAKGFGGRSCLEATRKLEAALGRITADRLTAEFFAPTEQPEQLQAHGEA